MRAPATLAAVVVVILAASGEQFMVRHREKVDRAAISFKSRHLSIEQCNGMNYAAGRETAWNSVRRPSTDTNAAVEPTETSVDTPEEFDPGETPGWILDMQRKGKDHHAGRKRRAKRYEDRLSEYSETELGIAKSLGLSPWDIDREQLKKWAQEAEIVPQTF